MYLVSRIAGRLARHAPGSETPELDRHLALRAPQASCLDAALAEIVRDAWAAGQNIDLDGVGYGPTHWDGEIFHAAPLSYYFFLAGLVRVQDCRTILELGTHYGGSCRAMLRGVAPEAAADILTIDISDINRAIGRTPGITKLVGDANSDAIIKQTVLHFANAPIDLLYVDADHHFGPTLTSLGIYCLLLRPRLIVIDDVLLNPQMRTLWDALAAAPGARAVNCIDIAPGIRESHVGFGLLSLH